MTTYTIAYGQVLYACVPDGDEAALERELLETEQYTSDLIERDGVIIEHGLMLTDDRPDDERRIAWQGHDLGLITDENNVPYEYAVRAA